MSLAVSNEIYVWCNKLYVLGATFTCKYALLTGDMALSYTVVQEYLLYFSSWFHALLSGNL